MAANLETGDHGLDPRSVVLVGVARRGCDPKLRLTSFARAPDAGGKRTRPGVLYAFQGWHWQSGAVRTQAGRWARRLESWEDRKQEFDSG